MVYGSVVFRTPRDRDNHGRETIIRTIQAVRVESYKNFSRENSMRTLGPFCPHKTDLGPEIGVLKRILQTVLTARNRKDGRRYCYRIQSQGCATGVRPTIHAPEHISVRLTVGFSNDRGPRAQRLGVAVRIFVFLFASNRKTGNTGTRTHTAKKKTLDDSFKRRRGRTKL